MSGFSWGHIRSSVWWAAGTACCCVTVEAALLNGLQRPFSYPILVLVSLVGAVVGPIWARRNTTWMSPALLFATVYPPALFCGVVIQGVNEGYRWGPQILMLLFAGAAGALAPVLRRGTRRPRRALRWGGIVWLAISIPFLFVVALGLVGVPLVISYFLAARSVPDNLRYRIGDQRRWPPPSWPA